MIVIENPSAHMNAGERAFVAHQRGKHGIILVNFQVGGGGPRRPGREIDAIAILPHGVFAVEVKYTHSHGELDSPLNDSWSVGGVDNPFSSQHRTPSAQADQAAKILATTLEGGPWPKGYITPVVAIHGNVTIPTKTRWVGTVGVATVEHFGLLVSEAKTRRIRAEHVGAMLLRLGVSKAHLPTREALRTEGFSDTSSEPVTRPSESRGDRGEAPVSVVRRTAWLTTPIGKARRTRLRMSALTAIAVMLGLWQLVSGVIFMRVVQPAPGDRLFLYGTWQQSWRSVHNSAIGGIGFWLTLLLAFAMLGVFEFAVWVRARLGAFTPIEAGIYLASIFGVICFSPVLFSGLSWGGVFLSWIGYNLLWPVGVVSIRAVWGPLGAHFDRAWRAYEI